MELRPYQIDISQKAYHTILKYGLAYISAEVRTGKSFMALETAKLLDVKNVLFVTKKKAIDSIKADYKHYAYFFKCTVINYEQLHNYMKDYDFIIIDEAHRVGAFPKPGKAQVQLRNICRNKLVLFLSGTPTPESQSQIFHQLQISSFSPFNEYATFYKWAHEYVNIKKKYLYNREVNDYSQAIEYKITPKIKHLFHSITQEEAGFQQNIEERVLYVEMEPHTYQFAERLLRDKIFVTKSGHEILGDTAVKMQNKLHQIYSGSVIDEIGEHVIFDSSKALFIKDYFKGKKIAIYYKFAAEGKMLERLFDTTGSPEEFANSDKVFISQFISGREGVNLSTADALIMFNIDFSSLSRLQTLGRMQSKDRDKENVVYWLFAKNGIEEKIYNIVKKKEDYTKAYFVKDFKYNNYERNMVAN